MTPLRLQNLSTRKSQHTLCQRRASSEHCHRVGMRRSQPGVSRSPKTGIAGPDITHTSQRWWENSNPTPPQGRGPGSPSGTRRRGRRAHPTNGPARQPCRIAWSCMSRSADNRDLDQAVPTRRRDRAINQQVEERSAGDRVAREGAGFSKSHTKPYFKNRGRTKDCRRGDPMFAGHLRSSLMLLQHRYNLLLREPGPLHQSVARLDSNSNDRRE